MKVKIRTLTPVHIGSGILLRNNTDFFTDEILIKDEKYPYLRIIDERKILELIGTEHLQDWLNCIDKGKSIKDFMKIYAPNAKTLDYSRRKIYLCATVRDDDKLKEQIHNGRGLPYIPGSSIKGALRTAITASLAQKCEELDSIAKIIPQKENPSFNYDNAVQEADKHIKDHFFGSTANSDLFRFLSCGDAYFKKGREISIRLQMYLNITHSKSLNPESMKKTQLIEALGIGEESEFELKLNTDYYQKVVNKDPSLLGSLPDEMKCVDNLFAAVNKHTLSLVKREIDFWNNQDKTGAESYVEKMEKMAEIIQANIDLGNKSCIMRLGHAIGWDFITGGWARKLHGFDKVVDKARYKNYKYKDYEFPKSRRLEPDGEMIGFIRLSR